MSETIIDELQVIYKHYKKAAYGSLAAGAVLGAYPSYELIQFVVGLF